MEPADACGFEGSVDSFQLELDPDLLNGCRHLVHVLLIQFSPFESLELASDLITIGGTLSVTSNERLRTLEGLEGLVELGGVYLDQNVVLEDISALSSVVRVHGPLSLRTLPRLASSSGLENIRCVGSLYVEANEPPILDGLASLASVVGDVELVGFPPDQVSAFLDRVDVDGEVVVDGEPWPASR